MSARARKPLKVGIVCEGQRGCAEEQVFPHLFRLICPEATYDIVPSGKRPEVLRNAPIEAEKLFEQGADVVFVVWDVFPKWGDHGGSTNCKEHCKILADNLAAKGMGESAIVPVAIRQMLEAWLLCDADALTAVIGTLTRKKPIPHENSPDSVSNPKVVIKELFKRGRGRVYNDSYTPGLIAAKLTSVERLRCSRSFFHFEKHLKRHCDSKK